MIRSILLIVCLLLLAGCPPTPPTEPTRPPPAERVPLAEFPNFQDDLDPESLRLAIERSLTYYNRVPPDRLLQLGDMQVTADLLKSTLLRFLALLESGSLDAPTIEASFDVYRMRSKDDSGRGLVTGYYEPILEGRKEPDKDFRHPLYSVPPDLVTADLSAFDSARFQGERLVGRVNGGKFVPYYTRAEIDGHGKIDGMNCRLVWLKDPVDAFFLQIQGSGMIRLPGDRYVRVGYASGNGRPYRSIGKYLIENGIVKPEEMSMQAIRSYLRAHPEKRDEVLWSNESYVFFRWVAEGPVGSVNVVLTPGRSVATDPKYHPQGAPAFLESERPIVDLQGRAVGRVPIRRWVLNQDTGGAIKGPGRVDLFCGTGREAEDVAGRLKNPGTLYFFLLKSEPVR